MKADVTGGNIVVAVEAWVWGWFRPSEMPKTKLRRPESKTQLAMPMIVCRDMKKRTGLFKAPTSGIIMGLSTGSPPHTIMVNTQLLRSDSSRESAC